MAASFLNVPGFRLPTHAGKLCVAVTGTSPEQLQENAAALLPDFPFQEFRLDYLAHPQTAIDQLRPFLQEHGDAFFLATCRPERSGGRLRGSASDELRILVAAADAGFPVVDLSLETAEELGPEALAHLRSHGTAVQLSFHDFKGTGDLPAVIARMRPFRPDLYKVVPSARDLDDSLRVLQLLRAQTEDGPLTLVAMAMGETGLLTRVLGPRDGSAFTFAAATEADATAPGQLTAHTLTHLYRIADIGGSTRVYGVAGDPISSSLSPLMLNTAFHATSTDAVYLPLKTGDAAELFRVARELPLDGFSVTMPLKQAVLPFLDEIDPLAARMGAVNTVHRTPEGKFRGCNTDAAGIVAPLEGRIDLAGAKVLVLGAGGAARAAVFGCVARGAHVSIVNRTPGAAESLAAEAGAVAVSRDSLATENYDVLINATPAGMRGNALTLPLEEHELRAHLIFDLVYNPLDTPLLALAREAGRATLPGVEMFIGQGARQFEIWTGKQAPTEAMRRAVLEILQRRTA